MTAGEPISIVLIVILAAAVALTMKRVAGILSADRGELEEQWSSRDVSTDDLRVALQRYRSHFDRLLAV